MVYLCTYIYYTFMPNAGKYSSPILRIWDGSVPFLLGGPGLVFAASYLTTNLQHVTWLIHPLKIQTAADPPASKKPDFFTIHK